MLQPTSNTYLYHWLQDAHKLARNGDHDRDITDNLAFTRTAGANHLSEPADAEHVENFRALITLLEDVDNDRADSQPQEVIRRIQSQANNYNVCIVRVSIRRSLYRTNKGRLGLRSSLTAEGDLVVVIRGCQWPLLLRPLDDGSFKIVAASYVHGLMYGEAMKERNDQGKQDTIFMIR